MIYEQFSTLVNNAKQAMVCTTNELLEWKDFPKGLRVLLLDEDQDSSNEIKAKLEEMEYIVSTFSDETEAFSAISSKVDSFHVAIVEVSVHNCNQRYKFLEIAKDLPTIMTSNEQCLSTMMKCIALGAVEFLIKPLSEDKLRNIWQHVVHKAYNTRGIKPSKSLKSIKGVVGPTLQIQHHNTVLEVPNSDGSPMSQDDKHDPSTNADKFPAPSTPQIEQGVRVLDDVDYHEPTNNSPGKETGETKFVDITATATATATTVVATNGESSADMEVDPTQQTPKVDESKGGNKLLSEASNKEDACDLGGNNGDSNEESVQKNLCSIKGNNKKKVKVDWTPDLHKKFVQAVEKLGIDQAIPSKILELMKVEGLTRHNVASHLQKYRMHRRHILPKEQPRRWPQPMNYYPPRQPMAPFPPYNTFASAGQVYQMWGPPGGRLPGVPMWGPPMENWQWKPPYPRLHADAWGCPVLSPSSQFQQVQHNGVQVFKSLNHEKNRNDLYPEEEVLDKMVKEAISKPWLPLPIGLKPPSPESVLAELCRQGISTIPHAINGHHHRFPR